MAPHYVPQDAPQGPYPYPYPFPGVQPRQPAQQPDPRRRERGHADPATANGFTSPAAGSRPYQMPAQAPQSKAARPSFGTRPHASHADPGRSYSGRMPAARQARTDPTLYEWDRLSPEQQQAVLTTIGGARAAGERSRLRTVMVLALVVLLALALLATVVAAVLVSQGHLLG